MALKKDEIGVTLNWFLERGLISSVDRAEILFALSCDSPLETALKRADSVHLHVRVQNVATLPKAEVMGLGATLESEQAGYLKFAFACGLNMIFSSIDVAVEDKIPGYPKPPRPYLDHLGVDLRDESDESRTAFDAIPAVARRLDWAHVPQGGGGEPVFCCHTEVKAKHWVFPRAGRGFSRPIEIAFGALALHGESMGCDLRPVDPSHPLAGTRPCCG